MRPALRMRLGLVATALAALPLLAALGVPALAQGMPCPGPNPQPHPYGSQNFTTNSRVGPPPLPGYKAGIVSCVTHDDPLNPLYVRWVIPGPHGYVPPKRRLESVARATNLDKPPQLKGCLLFGERGETTEGVFIGIEGDDRRAEDEQKRGCRAVVAAPARPAPSGIQGFIQRIINWWPSDASRPRATLMQFDGTVAIERRGDNGYASTVTYSLTPYEGSEGSAADITARPVFRGDTEALLPAFNESNRPPLKLSEKGEIRFVVASVPNPRLGYASYEMLDRTQKVVGSIDIPVFIPAR
jgi:hypothetical protein